MSHDGNGQLGESVRRFKRYPAYKDSRISWIRQIPKHWEERRLKHIVTCLDGKRIPLNSEQRGEIQGDYPYWGANGIVDRVDSWLFNENLVLLGEDGAPFFDTDKPVAFCVNGKVWVNNHAHVLRPHRTCDPAFLTEVLNTVQYRSFIDGTTRDKLTQGDMNEIPIQIPDLVEQRQIAAFLDRETAKIDALVAKKERLIDLLREKRTALISHTVTKGLDPNVPMKDSGVEWLGQIPAHWEVRRTKTVFRLVVDHAPEGNNEELLSLYTNIGVRPRKELEPKGNKSTTTDSYFYVKRGDLIVNKLLAWMGAIGVSDYEGVTSPAYDILRKWNPETNSAFYDYLFRCGIYHPIFRSRSRGIMDMRLRLYFEEFGQIPIPYPPEKDQNRIVEYLRTSLSKPDSLVATIHDGIDKLREYRTALISAAVTGKIDVREEVS